ncbi:hypothetical protein AK812_SmicGene9605 [Symbiodinium microadriaticum]|uniref:Uncharacterized protein n=1 Tax=Symbiodinium microadriaticum TaxID=2951 RepID=A0A1Q9EHW6_SYMMI|nr:hypothetical protein AK812_SmicGene9605 [Symbiodinium microadriaticum]
MGEVSGDGLSQSLVDAFALAEGISVVVTALSAQVMPGQELDTRDEPEAEQHAAWGLMPQPSPENESKMQRAEAQGKKEAKPPGSLNIFWAVVCEGNYVILTVAHEKDAPACRGSRLMFKWPGLRAELDWPVPSDVESEAMNEHKRTSHEQVGKLRKGGTGGRGQKKDISPCSVDPSGYSISHVSHFDVAIPTRRAALFRTARCGGRQETAFQIFKPVPRVSGAKKARLLPVAKKMGAKGWRVAKFPIIPDSVD